MRAKGNEGVAARIKQSDGSIGYVGYEFARKIGLKVALLENKEGQFTPPLPANCNAALSSIELPENLRAYVPDPAGAQSYPIVTFTWMLLYKNYADRQKAQALHDLFAWSLTDGQNMAPDLGYVPLPGEVAKKGLAGTGKYQLCAIARAKWCNRGKACTGRRYPGELLQPPGLSSSGTNPEPAKQRPSTRSRAARSRLLRASAGNAAWFAALDRQLSRWPPRP